MLRAVWVLSLVLAFCIENGSVLAASDSVVDDREASFLPPPAELLPSTATAAVNGKEKPAEPAKTAPVKVIPEISKDEKAKIEQPVSEARAAAQTSSEALVTPPPFSPPVGAGVAKETALPVVTAVPAVASAAPSTPIIPPAVTSAPLPEAAPAAAVSTSAAIAPVAAAPVKAAEQKIVDAPLADIDPETLGLLSPSNGGLEVALWKDITRDFIDRLMPSVILPTPSATLNDLARRTFLSTAAPPAFSGEKPKRSLIAQRIEALMALGAVPEAWKLASLARPELVDPVTLRLLAEASLIGPDSKTICEKIPSLMAAHAKTDESAAEWQKSLLICQLRDKDMKAVQLNVDVMREQGTKDALFLSLVSKNVIGESKQLPRQLTPLRPTNLAVLRQLDIPLPPELYARPDAALIPELLLAKAADEKARLTLAEKAGAKGILTPTQLGDIYKSVSVTPQDMSASAPTEMSVRARAIAYQAALNEQGGQKKIELAQRFIGGVEPSVLTGAQIKLAANLLENIPLTTDYNVSSVGVARIFAMAGRPDKTLAWLKLARDAAGRSPAIEAQLVENWPLFVLLGVIPDGDYAQGMKAWMGRALGDSADGKEAMDKREKAGKILLLLNAAGYAVPEEGWQRVMEIAPPSKQITTSPLIQERLRQASSAGRKGETILLSLVSAGGGLNEASLGAMTEIVRALRLVGLTAEAQALAREVAIGLSGT